MRRQDKSPATIAKYFKIMVKKAMIVLRHELRDLHPNGATFLSQIFALEKEIQNEICLGLNPDPAKVTALRAMHTQGLDNVRKFYDYLNSLEPLPPRKKAEELLTTLSKFFQSHIKNANQDSIPPEWLSFWGMNWSIEMSLRAIEIHHKNLKDLEARLQRKAGDVSQQLGLGELSQLAECKELFAQLRAGQEHTKTLWVERETAQRNMLEWLLTLTP